MGLRSFCEGAQRVTGVYRETLATYQSTSDVSLLETTPRNRRRYVHTCITYLRLLREIKHTRTVQGKPRACCRDSHYLYTQD
jgi:hypothetical protein